MTNQARSSKQILNIGEVIDLDGYGTWAIVESWDESSDIYMVSDRLGAEYEYIHDEVEKLDWARGGKVRRAV